MRTLQHKDLLFTVAYPMKLICYFIIVVPLVLTLCSSCRGEPHDKPVVTIENGNKKSGDTLNSADPESEEYPCIKYFKSFKKWESPIILEGEMSEKELKKIIDDGYAYFEAHYDPSGKLFLLNKISEGIIIGKGEYQYSSHGKLIKVTTTSPSDPTYGRQEKYYDNNENLSKILNYDKDDRIIEERVYGDSD